MTVGGPFDIAPGLPVDRTVFDPAVLTTQYLLAIARADTAEVLARDLDGNLRWLLSETEALVAHLRRGDDVDRFVAALADWPLMEARAATQRYAERRVVTPKGITPNDHH